LLRHWPHWAEVLVIVKSKTVVGWHRAGFRWYWRGRCLPRVGRPKISEEIRQLIRQMAQENAGWGAPRSTENCKSSVSSWQNGPWLDTCGAFVVGVIPISAG
jgi:hypothetical protein